MIATLLVVTATMYGALMLFPTGARIVLYMDGEQPLRTSEEWDAAADIILEKNDLEAPFLVQYFSWIQNLFKGNWGYSWMLGDNIFHALLRYAPATIELTIYSLLLLIPLGMLSGMMAGLRKNSLFDWVFRIFAFTATSVPLFIVVIIMLSIFYISLHWFPPGRIGISTDLFLKSGAFKTFTGLLTIDGLLNGRWDISLEAFRHLAIPVFALSLAHWATLSRVTRATVIDELGKEYIVSASAKGLPWRVVVWRHIFRNVLTPVLTNSALSATSLISGVYIVELICNFRGISNFIIFGLMETDIPAVIGFSIYSILSVLLIMFVLDLAQAITDPRIREEVMGR
ncbi:MAG: ABC transporter permease [Anaerolineaceae bacterium]|nr:ABC transporter permease [Anaerolineaceae bacterium]